MTSQDAATIKEAVKENKDGRDWRFWAFHKSYISPYSAKIYRNRKKRTEKGGEKSGEGEGVRTCLKGGKVLISLLA
jgi:hypothetical protein